MKASSIVFDRVCLEFGGRAGRSHATCIHGDEPIEALRLFHIGRRYEDAHAGTARTHAIDQVPELSARQRINSGRWLIEDEEVGIVDEGAADPELLTHAAGELFGRPIVEGSKAGTGEELGDALVALGTRLTE